MTDRSSFLDGVYDFTRNNLRTLKARWRDFAGEKAAISTLLSDSDADRLRRQMQDCLEARGGEVSARARAAALGQTYLAAPEEGRARFLRLLADEFDIDRVAVASACQRVAHARSEDERRRIERALRQALGAAARQAADAIQRTAQRSQIPRRYARRADEACAA